MPLKPLVFEILLALADEPRHGWTLVGRVEESLGERLLPGNFYRTLRRMLADGLIEESRLHLRSDPADSEDHPRRRYFQLTREGQRVARAEARRLERLVRDSRTRRLLKVDKA